MQIEEPLIEIVTNGTDRQPLHESGFARTCHASQQHAISPGKDFFSGEHQRDLANDGLGRL